MGNENARPSDYSVCEYSRIEMTASVSSVRSLLCQNAPFESCILRKAAGRKRPVESWNNEGVRAEMRTRRNCDAAQLKRSLDAERSVHFLLGVNWKCSYLSCAMERMLGRSERARETISRGSSPSRNSNDLAKRDKAIYFTTVCFGGYNKSIVKTYLAALKVPIYSSYQFHIETFISYKCVKQIVSTDLKWFHDFVSSFHLTAIIVFLLHRVNS